MKEFQTKYGNIKGIVSSEFYGNGMLKECTVNLYNELATPWGIFVPQYEDSGLRRKHIKSISFYENGTLKSISLNEQIKLQTSAGIIPAEYITFYESDRIKRILPLNGNITAYWTEDDEYRLTDELTFDFPCGSFKSRIIGILFYKCGMVKSLTLWPRNSIEVLSPVGSLKSRIGISLYPTGEIKSLEPELPVAVITPIGRLMAFNAAAIGINGDANSLCFYKNGNIMSLATSTDYIIAGCPDGGNKTFGPSLKSSLVDSAKKDIQPEYLYFNNGEVWFGANSQDKYCISKCSFSIDSFPELLNLTCSDCSNCNACGANKYEF